MPEGAIVVDESVTTGRGFFPFSAGAPPHDWLNNMGGSIGFGGPVAVGAAVACPNRKVICMIGDGRRCTRSSRCGRWRARISTSA